ncbi:uncharacterized protein N7511_001724 [Penicillium nucicola]|uniref:uncharacterized protein n=1 Tax=Penicillium nucicola TaxID=1850975 RepID=UPI002545BB12|nr:uncharacterized protein N7511_001724 [Penicillium nucicola]KAJ5776713.1 hypothetical protein N7511_001724 [Penicillium nucicola]
MSNHAGYVANSSGITPPASNEYADRALQEQNQDVDKQACTQVNQGTGLQYQPDLSGNEHVASNFDVTESQIDDIVANGNASTTRYATLNHGYATSGDHVETHLPNLMQTSKESSHKLGDFANGQKNLPVIDGHNHFDTISSGQVHHDAAPTTRQKLHDKASALVDDSSGQELSQGEETPDHIETLLDHNIASPTMLATLQNKAYGLIGASLVHHNLIYQKIKPETLIHSSNTPSMVATLEAQAYAMINGPVEVMKKDLNADSHELAHEVPKVQGAIQTEYTRGSNTEAARDIGWHKANVEIPDPLVGGYTNGELFAFIRRFNKDVFDVKAVSIENASGLDLNDAWSQDHAGDKVGLHLQRVYLTVVLGIASLGKQISRLRSWKETCRTSIFCAVYFAAWLFDLLMPLALGILIMVVSSVQVRNMLFPSAPRALVNIRTGGIQKPQAGLLGTNDTITGAPEKQPHEAIEEEAANFVDNVRHNIQRAVGMHNSQQQDGDGDPLEGKVPKPISKAVKAVQSAGSAPGHVTESTDQTQQPMEEIIWAGVNPESIANVLDIAPHVMGELAVIIGKDLRAWLKRNVPNYKELAQPKNNFLRGVPTNTQIAITLLRISEAHKTPLPPVPTSYPDDPDHQNPIEAENIPLGATRSDVLHATMPSIVEKAHSDDDKEKPNHKHLSKIVRFFKGNAKSVFETKLAIDHVRAATGSQKAKGHLGVLPKTKSIIYAGPSVYQCRFEGKHGWAVITESARPSLLFTRDDPRLMSSEKLEPVFEIAVGDMKRVKRATAFVNTAIEAVAAVSSDQKLLASLEIEDKEEKTWRLTVIPERDELFNRLVATGNQRWENM